MDDFIEADQDCFNLCKNNKELIPKYIRTLDLGFYQILAVSSTNPKKYYLIDLGGSDYNAHENGIAKLNKLTIKDAISWNQLKKLI